MSEHLSAAWEALEREESATGTIYRRLYPNSLVDLRAVLDPLTGLRSLQFIRSWDSDIPFPTLFSSRAVKITAEFSDSRTKIILSLVLTDSIFSDIFGVLVDDVAAAAARGTNIDEATEFFIDQLGRWRELLESVRPSGLTDKFRRGLFGELCFLQNQLIPSIGAMNAILGWTGPERANQDFQFEHCAIEVKTTTGMQPQSIVISNERELDEKGANSLYMMHLSLDERRGGIGHSLNAAIDEIDARLIDVETRRLFRSKLNRYGYFHSQREAYDEPRYTLRDIGAYKIIDGFPRIVESNLLSGVGAVRYDVNVAACQPYRVGVQEVVRSAERLLMGYGKG